MSLIKTKRSLYGIMGLLSLVGIIGIISSEKSLLAFFAFAVHFQYFFMESDEMMEEYMNKSAARGFYSGMIATAIGVLYSFFAKNASEGGALLTGFAFGWAVAVVVHALSTAYYGFREKWGLEA